MAFTVRLSEAEAARLAQHTANLGLKNGSETIRHWINTLPLGRDEPAEQIRKVPNIPGVVKASALKPPKEPVDTPQPVIRGIDRPLGRPRPAYGALLKPSKAR